MASPKQFIFAFPRKTTAPFKSSRGNTLALTLFPLSEICNVEGWRHALSTNVMFCFKICLEYMLKKIRYKGITGIEGRGGDEGV